MGDPARGSPVQAGWDGDSIGNVDAGTARGAGDAAGWARATIERGEAVTGGGSGSLAQPRSDVCVPALGVGWPFADGRSARASTLSPPGDRQPRPAALAAVPVAVGAVGM